MIFYMFFFYFIILGLLVVNLSSLLEVKLVVFLIVSCLVDNDGNFVMDLLVIEMIEIYVC